MPTPLTIVQCFLRDHGLQVGDYHLNTFGVLVQVGRPIYQLRVEGWGAECVQGVKCATPARLRARAGREAEKLAAAWKREGYDHTGVLYFGHPDVWALTWAVHGPVSPQDARNATHLDRMKLRC